MPLSPGARLGRHEKLELLGTGGMGQVYRAVDGTLGREVAIKVLPDAFAKDPERLARFAREARLLASLNHPNIAVVHALERADDMYYLEMELVCGETLESRLARGPFPLTDALQTCKQIAEGLEAAHRQGIIHRDLKPANIMITPHGIVKLLDFGLAKVITAEHTAAPPGDSPTLAFPDTEIGLVVGTAAYMSPEQARADLVDRRTDIWAFGCVLYEVLTGRRAFPGRTTSDTIGAVINAEPDWARLAVCAPPRLQLLVRRCLRKDPHVRLHDIADARIEIDEVMREPLGSASTPPAAVPSAVGAPVRNAGLFMAGALAAAAVWAGVAWWNAAAPLPAPSLARSSITLPAGQVLEKGRFTPLALSPDGNLLVYVAGVHGGQTRLYLRRLDELETRPIPSTEGANTPFFSPDGQWIGFYADGALKKVSLAGGVPLTIAEAPPVWSATWTGNDVVFATTLASGGLWLVSSDGGKPVQVTTPVEGEMHGYPQFLPGGTHVLFSILRPQGWQPAWLSLADREWRPIGGGRVVGEGAQYVPTGHLVSVQSGGLIATPFDPESRELGDAPIPLLERVETSRFGGAYFAVAADTGSLVYVGAGSGAANRTLLRVDRQGRAEPMIEARTAYEHPAVSPDGRQVAVTVASESGSDIWIIDLERGTRVRFTSGNSSAFPVWAPDGSRLAYQSTAPGRWNLYWKPIDRSAEEQPLFGGSVSPATVWPSATANLLPGTLPTLSGANPQFPASWAPDHSALAFHERKPNGERDIWVIGREGEPSPFLLTPFDERSPKFSPDGRWLAYTSSESGRDEVYVQPYPGPGPKWLVSTDGGVDPVWSKDGRDLFYRQGDKMMAVSVTPASAFSASRPRQLFETPFDTDDNGPNYDVSPDGRWFVMPRSEQAPAPAQLHLVVNWFNEIRTRISTAK